MTNCCILLLLVCDSVYVYDYPRNFWWFSEICSTPLGCVQQQILTHMPHILVTRTSLAPDCQIVSQECRYIHSCTYASCESPDTALVVIGRFLKYEPPKTRVAVLTPLQLVLEHVCFYIFNSRTHAYASHELEYLNAPHRDSHTLDSPHTPRAIHISLGWLYSIPMLCTLQGGDHSNTSSLPCVITHMSLTIDRATMTIAHIHALGAALPWVVWWMLVRASGYLIVCLYLLPLTSLTTQYEPPISGYTTRTRTILENRHIIALDASETLFFYYVTSSITRQQDYTVAPAHWT